MCFFANRRKIKIDKYVTLQKHLNRQFLNVCQHLHSGRNTYRIVAVSFGLLCILQVAVNITLRLSVCKNSGGDVETGCLIIEDRGRCGCKSFQQGWVYFGSSLYFISSTKLPWLQSRDDCQQRGADLVIINSKEEQNFMGKFHRLTWIGLIYQEETMNWKWVDGTSLTESYWGQGEPNGYMNRNESCVEIRFFEQENSWNDIPCYEQNFWICEKNAL
uniref:C-type lectin domain-containing protein n=1 Tax=Oryzias latipes TaxID=8090 RepID=A0A3P9IYQ4_ORYLA